jgi:hypothetical protein
MPYTYETLAGYKRWVNSLVPMEIGTVIQWVKGYNQDTVANAIKPGQYTKVMRIRKSNGISDMPVHAQVYTLRVCRKDGKEFKKEHVWNVEGIARRIHGGEINVS